MSICLGVNEVVSDVPNDAAPFVAHA